MFDKNLFFRNTTANLTATETSAVITVNETPISGLSLNVIVPTQSVGDTMQVALKHSTDNSTYTTLIDMDVVASVTQTVTTPMMFRKRFATRLKYLKTVITVAGTSPDYGAVQVFIGDLDWVNNYTTSAATTAEEV